MTLPDSPAWDAHCLDNADHNLSHEYEEKCHEVEGAVSPEKKGKARSHNNNNMGFTCYIFK